MSQTTKAIIWIVVILAVIAVGVFLFNKPAVNENGIPERNDQQQAAVGAIPAMSKADDTSDAALEADTASIDAKIKAFDAASANSAAQ